MNDPLMKMEEGEQHIMGIPNERNFLVEFIENLKASPVRLKNHPLQAIWTDKQGRANTCQIRYYITYPPIMRVAINWKNNDTRMSFPLSIKKASKQPDWSFELTCLHDELLDFAPWLAGIVNQKEGLIKSAPQPPVSLFKWKEEDFLFYKATNSIWSQMAYDAEHNWWHRRVPQAATGMAQLRASNG